MPKIFGKESEPQLPPLTAQGLLLNANIVPYPSYYSGITANARDINAQKLFTMFDTLDARINFSAANDFARMIRDLQSLAPSNIVNEVYKLEANNWVYSNKQEQEVVEDITDPDALALLEKIVPLIPSSTDESVEIKQQFFSLLDELGIVIEDPIDPNS